MFAKFNNDSTMEAKANNRAILIIEVIMVRVVKCVCQIWSCYLLSYHSKFKTAFDTDRETGQKLHAKESKILGYENKPLNWHKSIDGYKNFVHKVRDYGVFRNNQQYLSFNISETENNSVSRNYSCFINNLESNQTLFTFWTSCSHNAECMTTLC